MALGPAFNLQLSLFLPVLLSMASIVVMPDTACTTGNAVQKPKSLNFYMYVSVQNNSDLHNARASYTAVQSAQPPSPQPNSFGIIHTYDNPITTHADLSSTHVGRAQGWYGDVGQSVLTLFLVQTFTYNDDKFKGSFSLMGVDVATDARKFAPIVGGTGDFAYVRGVAELRLVSTADLMGETVSWFNFNITFKH